MKKISGILLIASLHLGAAEDGVGSYWNKAVEGTGVLWDKTKQITNDTYEGAKDLTLKGYDKSKGFVLDGKKSALEKTLLLSMNIGLRDNKTISVDKLKIDEVNGTLMMKLVLDGEDKPLIIDVQHFDWDIIQEKDKKMIVIEKLKIAMDIPWIDYAVNRYLSKNNYTIKVDYTFAKETFLGSLKDKVPTSYVEMAKEENTILQSELDKASVAKEILDTQENSIATIFNDRFEPYYIKAKNITKVENGVEATFSLKGSQNDFGIYLTDFKWATANNESLIVIGKIVFKNCTKPWVASLLKKHSEQIIFEYDETFKTILESIKPKTQGSIE